MSFCLKSNLQQLLKSILFSLWLLLTLVCFCGCASYNYVKVQVIDDTTHKPIAGARVATHYIPKPFSLADRRQDIEITDQSGMVLLRANYFDCEPTLYGKSEELFRPAYCITAVGYLDADLSPSPNDDNLLLHRPASYKPQKPDIVAKLEPDKSREIHPPWFCEQTGFFRQCGYDF